MNTYQTLKSEIKSLAETIRKSRLEFKNAQRSGSSTWTFGSTLASASWDFRHKHIVISLLRGRTRDQIEQVKRNCTSEKKCYCCNRPDEPTIASMLAHYQEGIAKEQEAANVANE